MAKIQVTRVLKANLPTLDEGEFAFCTDTGELFIGSQGGNIQIGTIDGLGISLDELSDIDLTTTPPSSGDVLKYDNGIWKPVNISSSIAAAMYLIELKRWGIKNDGTDAVNTTRGINDALVWASQNGYSGCKLPTGIYLVDKDSHINLVSDITLDLVGCTIKKEPNAYQNYSIINIFRKNNVTIFGGTIEGDKDSHDYSSGGTHEWGIGIEIKGNRNIKIDSVKIYNTTGNGIRCGSTYGHLSWVYLSDLESGTFHADGTLKEDIHFVRSNKSWSLSGYPDLDINGYFALMGNGYGAFGTRTDGSQLNLDRTFITFYFFDDSNNYLGSVARRSYDNIYKKYIPKGATKFKLGFRYNLADISSSSITIRSMSYTKGATIVNCDIMDCRTLGIAVTGAQNLLIENCEISGIGGASPGYGIDVEDGYNINQNIIIRNNYFHHNKNGSLVVISARNVLVESNKFYGSVTLWGSRGENYLSRNNLYNGVSGGGSSGSGGDGTYLLFENDYMSDTQVFLNGDSVIYDGVYFDNTSFILQQANYQTTTFRNCKFMFDRPEMGYSWILRKGSLYFENCQFDIRNCRYYYMFNESHFGDPLQNNFTMKNCEISTHTPFGGYSLNHLTLSNNTIKGTTNNVYQYFNFKANKAVLENNSIESVNFVLDGLAGISPSITIRNNIMTISKTSLNHGPDRNEGIYLRKFDYVYFSNNQIFFPHASAYQSRALSVFGEKLINLTDNHFLSPDSTNKIELHGAWRSSTDTTPIPPLVSIINDNYSRKILEVHQPSFTSQLSKPIIGNGLTNLD